MFLLQDEVRSFAPAIRDVMGTSFVALHARIEDEWASYCQGLAHAAVTDTFRSVTWDHTCWLLKEKLIAKLLEDGIKTESLLVPDQQTLGKALKGGPPLRAFTLTWACLAFCSLKRCATLETTTW